MQRIDVQTPHGLAGAHFQGAEAPRGGLILGHGAGGGIGAGDLQAVAGAALAHGFSVALVEQPYRVAGRRAPAPAHQLDSAWVSVVTRLAARRLKGLGLVLGGRSAGARVACRTAEQLGAVGVVCLAFPLVPPRRAASPRSAPSRLPELEAVPVPTLVVQGRGDRFGMPPPGPQRQVAAVAGDHSLRSDSGAVAGAVAEWLEGLFPRSQTGRNRGKRQT